MKQASYDCHRAAAQYHGLLALVGLHPIAAVKRRKAASRMTGRMDPWCWIHTCRTTPRLPVLGGISGLNNMGYWAYSRV